MRLASALLGAVALALSFSVNAESRRPRILTSFLPLYCFATNVTGDAAQVDTLLTGRDHPHEYQLSVKARRRIEASDLVVLHGLGLDAWVEPALGVGKKQRVVVASAGLSSELIRFSGVTNPHIWLDPTLAAHCVETICRAVAELDPEHT